MAGKEAEDARAQKALSAAHKEHAFHWPFVFPEVFEKGGFSAFIGNPPFVGGQRISGQMGQYYLNYLNAKWDHTRGSADICAYFFLRAFENLRDCGTFGLIATNTIAQGDTRERGLDYLSSHGATIYGAVPSTEWPGTAAVFVSIIHIRKGDYTGEKLLDGKPTLYISSLLDNAQLLGAPCRLVANTGRSFQGVNTLGTGFLLKPDEAVSIVDLDERNREVIFPFLNGEDLNSSPNQAPSRWAINFFNWALDKASNYAEPFEVVKNRVKPEREHITYSKNAHDKWWLYERSRPEMFAAIRNFNRITVIALTSRTLAFCFVPSTILCSHATVIIANDKSSVFAILQSTIHTEWARKYGSSMKSDARYTPTDCFETFPFPTVTDDIHLETIGEMYHEVRRQIMLARQEGLTKTYNRFHDPCETNMDISHLRLLHVEIDNTVVAAYGWTDLELDHGFHETAQGVRYTISESARREVLARLLRLNHERYEEEVRAGLHEKKRPSGINRYSKTKGKLENVVKKNLEEYRLL